MRGYGSIVRTCLVCKEQYKIPRSEAERRKGGTCSMDCCRIARRNGLIRRGPGHGRPWSEDDLEILRQRYHQDGPEAVAKRLRRSRSATCCKARAIGIARVRSVRDVRRWSKEENDWLRENYARFSWPQLEEHLGRSSEAIRIQAVKLQARRLEGDCWTSAYVGDVFGVTATCVRTWIEKGLISAKLVEHIGSHGTYQIQPAAVRQFIFRHPLAFNIRKVDQLSFIDLCQGKGLGAAPSGDHS